MKSILLAIILSVISTGIRAQNQPQLIKDITPGSANSDITEITVVGDIAFFIAPDGSNGFQLWRTDGTEQATHVIKVINPGATGMYSYITSLVNVDGVLFFLADDGTHGVELWKSDGTEPGTVLIKDIYPGISDAFTDFGIEIDYQAVIGDILYFNASDNGNDYELWRSDGTETGTYRVKDIVPGNNGSFPELLTNAGDVLYFECKNSNGLHEVWKSDGTETGTMLLKEVPYVPETDGNGANFFIEYNGYVYFTSCEVAYDEELYRTDGTPSGTGMFMDLNPNDGSKPRGFCVLNDKLFFYAEDENENHWFTSDGTIAGTQLLHDINGNPAAVDDFSGIRMLLTGEKLYYPNHGSADEAMWITDGTPAGTFKVANLELGYSTNETALGNNIVFRSYDEANGCYTLYESDGTSGGTFQSFDCDVVTPNDYLVTLGNKVIFIGTSDIEGREIWSYDPSFPSGIETLSTSAIQVYPNPSSDGIFQFSIPKDFTNASVNVYDILGRDIHAVNENAAAEVSVDLSSFSKGIYFLEIKNETQRIVSKLICD